MSRGAYLNALGIETWVERRASAAPDEQSGPAPSVEPLPLWRLQDAVSPVASVVVGWPDRGLDLAAASPPAELLLRMLGALEQPLERFSIVGWVQDDPRPAVTGEPVFCLADRDDLPPGWIALPSLNRMLNEGRRAKGEAWTILKTWIPRLSGR